MGLLSGLLKECRPRQWIKNLLIFAGLVFSQNWRNPLMVRNAILGFVVFCALSSVVYIINDIFDVEQDRQHPKKRNRPIASGRVPIWLGWAVAAAGCVGGLALAFALTRPFGYTALIYIILTIAYSVRLKNVVVLDILILALGFVLRALGGIEVISIPGADIPITSYFLLTTLFLALFLAICKRRNELVLLGADAANHRPVLGEYSVGFLDVLLMVATAGTLFSYALWTTQGQFSAPLAGGRIGMIYTIPFVLYGIFRYIWLVFRREEGGAPEILLLTDFPLLTTVLLWGASVIFILLHLAKAAGPG